MRHKKTTEKKMKGICVLIAVALLILTQFTYASDAPLNPQSLSQGISKRGMAVAIDEIMRAIFIYINAGTWVLMYGTSFSDHFREAILSNPSYNPQSPSYNPAMSSLTNYLINLITPLYIVAIIATATYMLFLSGSPQGKEKSKELLKRIILSMILFYLSPLILEAMLVSSQSLSTALLDSVDLNNAREVLLGGLWGGYWVFAKIGMTSLELGGPFFMSTIAMSWLPYIIVLLRYILVTFFCIVFPLGVILYSWNLMRGLGRKILEQTIIWIFMQVFLSAAIVAISISINFYYIVPPDQDIKLSGVNFMIPPIGGVGIILTIVSAFLLPYLTSFLASFADSTFLATSILRFTLGAASYALFVAVPFLMVRILNNFLP